MRGDEVVGALAEFADTLVADVDVAEFLQRLTDRCVELLPAMRPGRPSATGRVVAVTGGEPVGVADLAAAHRRWPRLAPAPRELGFSAVQALPMRRRADVIGAMNPIHRPPGELAPARPGGGRRPRVDVS